MKRCSQRQRKGITLWMTMGLVASCIAVLLAATPVAAAYAHDEADGQCAESALAPASVALTTQASPSQTVYIAQTGKSMIYHLKATCSSMKSPRAMTLADAQSAGYRACKVCASGNDSTIYTNMHRLYNPWSGEHFYTGNTNEKNSLVKLGWRYEGVGWHAPSTGKNVYRLYNPYSGDHHFTTDAAERDACLKAGWNNEGVGWKSGGSVKILREYNPYAKSFYHNYTADTKEHSKLCSIGWKDEGIGWYGA